VPAARPTASSASHRRGEDKERSRPISRVLSWTTIHLRYASPRTSSDLPGDTCGPHVQPIRRSTACPPIWSCSGRGLPCHRVLPPARCALTAPFHPYRRAAEATCLGGLLSVALSVGSRPPGVTWRLALGARTFLHPRERTAVVWPTPGRIIQPNSVIRCRNLLTIMQHMSHSAPVPNRKIAAGRLPTFVNMGRGAHRATDRFRNTAGLQ
jgi:hypothetical protein